jgi:hypothetical protein
MCQNPTRLPSFDLSDGTPGTVSHAIFVCPFRVAVVSAAGCFDSDDGIFHRDGLDADGPIALCEVGAYVYAVREAAARIAAAFEMNELPVERRRAARIENRFICTSVVSRLALGIPRPPMSEVTQSRMV